MADRKESNEQSNAKSAPQPTRGDQSDAGHDDGLEQNSDPDSQKSTTSRPRGHTEEPDRTL